MKDVTVRELIDYVAKVCIQNHCNLHCPVNALNTRWNTTICNIATTKIVNNTDTFLKELGTLMHCTGEPTVQELIKYTNGIYITGDDADFIALCDKYNASMAYMFLFNASQHIDEFLKDLDKTMNKSMTEKKQ